MGKKLFDVVFSPISLIVGDKVGHAITGAFLVVAGIATGNLQLAALGIGMAASSFAKKPGVNKANVDRLTASLDPNAPRKAVFGTTAMATDVRYQTYTGTNQDSLSQILCVAAHQVQSIDEIWFENEKAWTSGGGAQGRFAGYLTVTTRLVGTSANGIAVDGVWTVNSRMTGCAYILLVFKLTGTSSKATSPFSSGIPSRVTVRGNGALVYDPRLDSTVTGGSGAQRAADQTTWAWSSSASRNPALQLLWYLIGWRIQNPSTLAWRLSVGRGIPPSRIDLPSFIAAANVCDETVSLAGGGTQPRYRSDGVFSEGDDPSTVIGMLLSAMNAQLRDAGGKLSLVCFKNDLGTPIASFTEDDLLGGESWEQTPGFDKVFNIVRGRYTDPSDNALYQLSDYPEVSLASLDTIDRIATVDFAMVQSSAQAQRLAKQYLQRNQYQGRFTGTFGFRAWQVSLGDVVQLSHASLGWTNKLFRVVSQGPFGDNGGAVPMVLQEENAAIYAWSAEDSAAVTAAAPTIYNPLNDPRVAGILAATSTIFRQATDPAASAQDGDLWIDTSVTPNIARARISGTWQIAANYVTTGPDIGVAAGATKNTLYRQASAPSSPIDGDLWVDTSVTPNVTKIRIAGAWQIAANYVTSGPDIGVAAGASADLHFKTIGTGTFTIVGNTITKADANGWQSEVVSLESYQDGAAVSFLMPAQGSVVGLTRNFSSTTNTAAGNGYYDADFGLNWNTDGTWHAWEGGVTIILGTSSGGVTFGAATQWGIVYQSGKVVYYADGVAIRTVTGVPTGRIYRAFAGQGTNGLVCGSAMVFDPSPDRSLLIPGTGAKLGDARQLPNVIGQNLGYKINTAPTYTAAAGTPATATISMGAFSLYYGDQTISYNASSANVTGTGGTTVTYFLYMDDAANAGGSQTLNWTTTGNTIYQANGRILVGSVDVFFPTSGSGSGGGGGGGGGFCVSADAWVETRNRGFVRAGDVERGDILRVLDDAREGVAWEACTANSPGTTPVWRIVSASGAIVTVSESTPIVLRDGRIVSVADIGSNDLPVLDGHGFRWEPCRAWPAGAGKVAKILCNQRTYAAGDVPGRSILTHNPKP